MSVGEYTIQAVICPGDESGYMAECLDLAVVTQGETLDQTVGNLRKAILLHLKGEGLEKMGLMPSSPVMIALYWHSRPGIPPDKRQHPDRGTGTAFLHGLMCLPG